ncbi:putative helicase MOV-10 [Armigeres subalbatus]|uniref:putative helicase MOV-10 n=1 Tax=Armigeres subalbatus TaxID=124917 RepID=UPI002ED027BE
MDRLDETCHMESLIQWMQNMALQENSRTKAFEKCKHNKPESRTNGRKTKHTISKNKKNVESSSDAPLSKINNNPKHMISTEKKTLSINPRLRQSKTKTSSNETKSKKDKELAIDNIPQSTKKRPTFNRQWITKPVDTIILLPRSLKPIDPTKDCVICRERFRSERMFRSHVATDHGSGFKLDHLLSFDPRNRRIDRQIFELSLKQLPMAVPTFAITAKNVATVTMLLNSIYIFDGNVRLMPVFAGDQVLRMVPGYSFEEEVTLDDLVLVNERSYSLLITATPIIEDSATKRQIVEQFHFTEKESKVRVKKTELKMAKLPSYDIPRYVVLLYKSNYKVNDLYTDHERELLLLIKKSENLNSLTAEKYSEQLALLNYLEAQHLLQEYFNYTILEPVIVAKDNSRFFSISIDQFKQKPSLLNEEVKVVFMSEGKHRAEKTYGFIDNISKEKITFRMLKFVDKDKVKKVMFYLNRTTFVLEKRALELMRSTLIRRICFPAAVTGGPLEQLTRFEWIQKSVATNEEQKIAVRNITNQTSFPAPYILFGPPGTGKTTTLVEAIGQIYKLRPTVNILVAATSNYAANELTSRLLNIIPEETIFRFFASSFLKKMEDTDVDVLDVSNLAGQIYSNICYEDIYMCRVTVATLTTAGRLIQANIKSKHFSYVFIDECGSAKEISSLIPIAGLATNGDDINASIVLAGDPKQLGPVIPYEFLKQTTHSLSMLERMMNLPLYARNKATKQYNTDAIMQLRDNFRSHDNLLQFCNQEFYEGQLRAKAPHEIKSKAVGWWRLPNRNCPLIFHPIVGKTKKDDLTTSMFNKDEANQVMFYVSDLLNNGINGRQVNQSDIGILSPYARQVTLLKQLCSAKTWHDIEIGSAEQYQGREKTIIIISTVRSSCNSVGFLADPKRLNVSLTRAKSLMIVIGNMKTLEQDPLWEKFIAYCRQNNAIAQAYDSKQRKDRKSLNSSSNFVKKTNKTNKSSSSTPTKTEKAKKNGKMSKNLNLIANEMSSSESDEGEVNWTNLERELIQALVRGMYSSDYNSVID